MSITTLKLRDRIKITETGETAEILFVGVAKVTQERIYGAKLDKERQAGTRIVYVRHRPAPVPAGEVAYFSDQVEVLPKQRNRRRY